MACVGNAEPLPSLPGLSLGLCPARGGGLGEGTGVSREPVKGLGSASRWAWAWGEAPRLEGWGEAHQMAQRSCSGTSEMAPSSDGSAPLGPQDAAASDPDVCVSGELSWGGRRLLWRWPCPASPPSLAASMQLLSLSQMGYWM